MNLALLPLSILLFHHNTIQCLSKKHTNSLHVVQDGLLKPAAFSFFLIQCKRQADETNQHCNFLSSLTTCLHVIHNISTCGLVVLFFFFFFLAWLQSVCVGLGKKEVIMQKKVHLFCCGCYWYVVANLWKWWISFFQAVVYSYFFNLLAPPQEISTWKSLTVPYVLCLPWRVIVKQYFCITQLHLLILYDLFFI